MKVLIVDDSEDIRGLIRVILEGKGHTVVGEAEDGVSALKAFTALRPEMVLLDILMPGKSGIEVLEDIRKIDPEARVIIVTALEQDRLNRRLMLLGASGIIFKPFVPGDFEKAFHAALRQKPLSGEKNDTIVSLAAAGLSKCMLKTCDATSWAWELCEVSVFSGTIPDAVKLTGFGANVAAVQVNIRNEYPFSAAMVFRSMDIGFISSCFVNGPLYRISDNKDLEEELLMEIGSIILNSLTSPLISALNKIALPSMPIKGGPGAVVAGLSACLDPEQKFRIISAALAMRRDGRLARAGVLCFLPEELAAELERGGKAGAAEQPGKNRGKGQAPS